MACGRRMPPRIDCEQAPCIARCKAAGPAQPPPDYLACTHGELSDETAHADCGCASQRRDGQPTVVMLCDFYGRVTPLARSTKEGLRTCMGCAQYQGVTELAAGNPPPGG